MFIRSGSARRSVVRWAVDDEEDGRTVLDLGEIHCHTTDC